MFPDAHIEFQVDVYGQAYTENMLADVKNLVKELTGNGNIVKFFYD